MRVYLVLLIIIIIIGHQNAYLSSIDVCDTLHEALKKHHSYGKKQAATVDDQHQGSKAHHNLTVKGRIGAYSKYQDQNHKDLRKCIPGQITLQCNYRNFLLL